MIAPDAKQTTSQYGVIQSCLTASCVAPAGQPPPLGPNLTFNADGTAVSPFNLGVPGVGFATRIGGDGTLLGYGTSNVRPEVERYSAMAHVSYDVSDRLSWFGEVAYSSSDALGTPANGGLGPTGLRIQADNAFLTPAVAAALGPNGGQLARIFMPDVINAVNTTENETTRFVTGLEGELGSEWTWDVYYQHGKNENHQRLINNMVGSLAGGAVRPHDFLRWALDAVRSNPADPTSPIVCRATLPGPAFVANAAGCVPLNIFGNGNANPAALAYAFRTLKEDNEYTQDVLGVNFRTHARRRLGRPDRARDGARVASRRSRDDARPCESAVVQLVPALVRSRPRRRHRRARGVRGARRADDAKAEHELLGTPDAERGDELAERHDFGKGHVRELEGGRDLRSARVAAVPLDGFAGRARGRLPRALPAARHDYRLRYGQPILGTRA